MKRDLSILTTYWFLSGLFILLLNDFFLKDYYGNWITGKLSDFSGLLIFPVFWSALFPKHKVKIYVITAFVFAFWKSGYSESVIHFWNSYSFLTVNRVIDYTDLFALLILPVSFKLQAQDNPMRHLKIKPVIPIICSSFAFMATSYYTDYDYDAVYVFNFPKDTLKVRFDSIDTLNYGNPVNMSERNPDTVHLRVPCDICFDGMDAEIAIEELPDQRTKMTLFRASHSCPEEDHNKAQLLAEFERMVVQKLKDEN